MNQIFIEAKNLICKDGEVWLWKSDNMETVNFFATKEDAQKYIELRRQWRQEIGMAVESYSIGTEADYVAAVKQYEADKKANEVKEYCKHVDSLIEHRKLEIKALDGLIKVCRRFDGKVLNKRFHDAVKEETGFDSWFSENLDRYEIKYYGRNYSYNEEPYIYIAADFSHGYNRYTGQKKEIDPHRWQWNTGDRLETANAIAIIEQYKNDRLTIIKHLKATKRSYAAYLRLARKAEAIMKEMWDYDYEKREFAKEKALSAHTRHSYFWKGY